MLNCHEVCTRIMRASDVFTRVLVDELKEMECEHVKPFIEARWVRSRQNPDYMYCSSCFQGYDAFDPSERVLLPVNCYKYFHYCPLCGADTRLDDERCMNLPRFEDEMSDEERTAGSRNEKVPAVYNYDDMKQTLRNLGINIPHGNTIYPHDEGCSGDNIITNDDISN